MRMKKSAEMNNKKLKESASLLMEANGEARQLREQVAVHEATIDGHAAQQQQHRSQLEALQNRCPEPRAQCPVVSSAVS